LLSWKPIPFNYFVIISIMIDLIIIPGLADDVKYTKFLVRNWESKYNVRLHVISFGWNGGINEFDNKFKLFLEKVDEIINNGNKISIIGISAGASVAINTFYLRKDRINKAISVCGRLRDQNVKQRFYYPKEKLNIFKESILLCEKTLSNLTNEDRKRLLYFLPLFDDVVPVKTMEIKGASSKKIYSIQHMFNILYTIRIYSKFIIDFISS
jgi:hypothetical protein